MKKSLDIIKQTQHPDSTIMACPNSCANVFFFKNIRQSWSKPLSAILIQHLKPPSPKIQCCFSNLVKSQQVPHQHWYWGKGVDNQFCPELSRKNKNLKRGSPPHNRISLSKPSHVNIKAAMFICLTARGYPQSKLNPRLSQNASLARIIPDFPIFADFTIFVANYPRLSDFCRFYNFWRVLSPTFSEFCKKMT